MRSKNPKCYMSSDFYCTKCGRKGISIPRNIGQNRESGHLKKIYCIHCKDETNHVEIRDSGSYTKMDFLEEYALGLFVNGKRKARKDLLQCSCYDCLYNVRGRCYNEIGDYDCSHRRLK